MVTVTTAKIPQELWLGSLGSLRFVQQVDSAADSEGSIKQV